MLYTSSTANTPTQPSPNPSTTESTSTIVPPTEATERLFGQGSAAPPGGFRVSAPMEHRSHTPQTQTTDASLRVEDLQDSEAEDEEEQGQDAPEDIEEEETGWYRRQGITAMELSQGIARQLERMERRTWHLEREMFIRRHDTATIHQDIHTLNQTLTRLYQQQQVDTATLATLDQFGRNTQRILTAHVADYNREVRDIQAILQIIQNQGVGRVGVATAAAPQPPMPAAPQQVPPQNIAQPIPQHSFRMTFGPSGIPPLGPPGGTGVAVAPPAANPAAGKIKMNMPKEFDGTRGDVANKFKIACANYIKVNMQAQTDEMKILFIISFFTGAAAAWMEPVQILHNSGNPQTRMLNLDVFSSEFDAAFGEVEHAEVYRQKYKQLKQTKSVTEYITEFRLYSSVLGYNENVLKDDFYRGLKDSIKDILMTQNFDRYAVSLDTFMSNVSAIDARLMARDLEKKDLTSAKDKGKGVATGSPRTGNSTTKFKEGDRVFMAVPEGGYLTGEIKKITKNARGFLTPTVRWDNGKEAQPWFKNLQLEKKTGRREGAAIELAAVGGREITCYRCQKRGHIAKDCKEQIAALEEVEDSGKGDA
jgi:hypothetical protein